MLIALDSEFLDSFEEKDESLLVVFHIVGKQVLLDLFPLHWCVLWRSQGSPVELYGTIEVWFGHMGFLRLFVDFWLCFLVGDTSYHSK